MFLKNKRDPSPIGLLAGRGELPYLFAQAASSLGKKIILFGIEGQTDRRVEEYAQSAHYLPLGTLNGLPGLLKSSGVKKVVFAGGLPKKDIYKPGFQLDESAKGLIHGARNKGDDHLLRAFEIFLKLKCGVTVIDARSMLKDLLAPKGVLTRRVPTEAEWKDLKFGWSIAKGIGRLDIGQTVVVKEGMVAAIEAVEGTDAAIRRAGELVKGNAVVVKVSKPNQALKFDLPCVGPATLESLRAASFHVLGVEAGKTLILLRPRFIETADKYGMTIVGLS